MDKKKEELLNKIYEKLNQSEKDIIGCWENFKNNGITTTEILNIDGEDIKQVIFESNGSRIVASEVNVENNSVKYNIILDQKIKEAVEKEDYLEAARLLKLKKIN